MSQPAPTAPSPGAVALIEAGERLIARYGIQGVSLRQVAIEAHSANNSAVQYHFGSREGLALAIFEYRLPQLISERDLLASRVARDDLRGILEAYFLPLARLAEQPTNRYVRFVEQMQRSQPLGNYFDALPPALQRSSTEFVQAAASGIERRLPELPKSLRLLRLIDVQTMMLHSAADRERSVEAESTPVSFDLYVSSGLDCWVGYLTAPASDATLRAHRAAGSRARTSATR